MKQPNKEMDRSVVKSAGKYLFDECEPENWQNLYIRTHITKDQVFRAAFHLNFIAQGFGSRIAAVGAMLYQGQLLSIEPDPTSGRTQAVEVLATSGGNLPQRNVYRSVEPSVSGYEESQDR